MNTLSYQAVDTLYRIATKDGACLILSDNQSWFSCNVSVGDILTVLGFLITLGVFYKQLTESRKEAKENLRSNWFLDVIVQPKVSEINDLYITIIENTNKSRTALRLRYDQSDPAKEIKLDLARKQREVKDQIKDFFDHFRALLMASEPAIARKTDVIVDELVDIVTKYMDDYESENVVSCKSMVLANKLKLITALYEGLNKEKDNH